MLQDTDLQIGQRVLCVDPKFTCTRWGQLATITDVQYWVSSSTNQKYFNTLTVRWDDGNPHYTMWDSLFSFDPVASITWQATLMNIPQSKEAVCRNSACGKKNDIGVKTCWNCGIDKPC